MYAIPAKMDNQANRFCAKEKCGCRPTAENKYCGKHQLCVFIDETEALGKRNCKNVIRGCREQLDDNYEFMRCEPCRNRELERDNARKVRAAEKRAETGETEGMRVCKSCDKEQSLDEFVGTKNKGTVKSCKTCRETWKRNDEKRDKEHRNALAREAAKKPENIATKKAWAEANPEKREQTYKKSRAKRAAKDIDGYLQHNANIMKNWRDRNPEKMAEQNRQRRESVDAHFTIYARVARTKKLAFEFNKEEFAAIVAQPCYYCGETEPKGFNGIDRTDQRAGYTHANCVSCCTMCNWLKGCLDTATFVKRVRHILEYTKTGAYLHPECFPDSTCVSYASYRSRAEKKELAFELTHDEYRVLIQQSCYLCGKSATETHTNGIDRVDNAVGYVLPNCRACCRECNHMKKSFGLDAIMAKLANIRGVWNEKPLPVLPTQLQMIQENKNKMTKSEVNDVRKEKKSQALKKHCDYLASIGAATTSV